MYVYQLSSMEEASMAVTEGRKLYVMKTWREVVGECGDCLLCYTIF